MDSPAPHLILTHEGPIALDILETFEAAVASEGLDVRREARTPLRTSASMALLSSTGVGVMLTRAYFDAATASGFDTALGQLARRVLTSPRGAPAQDPLGVETRYSRAFSLWTERDASSVFKMLIPADPSADTLNAALGAYLAFARAYQTAALEPEDLEVLTGARPLMGVVLLAYDEDSNTIQPADPFEGRGLTKS